ncbi:hypothetical protein T11_16032 [Trichinella zimbabwensis]|uniref:Uncharacterized protein n=1 Tax=Trichinella zimbabwensis TaxID=268475 RepID=A0A0V1HNY0_9BILA|nr:hypothetical protein T11_16032 [Trichinella zimbabwensis]
MDDDITQGRGSIRPNAAYGVQQRRVAAITVPYLIILLHLYDYSTSALFIFVILENVTCQRVLCLGHCFCYSVQSDTGKWQRCKTFSEIIYGVKTLHIHFVDNYLLIEEQFFLTDMNNEVKNKRREAEQKQTKGICGSPWGPVLYVWSADISKGNL